MKSLGDFLFSFVKIVLGLLVVAILVTGTVRLLSQANEHNPKPVSTSTHKSKPQK